MMNMFSIFPHVIMGSQRIGGASSQGSSRGHRSPQLRRGRRTFFQLLEESRIEVDSFVQVPHLHVARLLLAQLVGELAEPLRGHPQEVDQLLVVRVVAEHLDQALDEPGKIIHQS